MNRSPDWRDFKAGILFWQLPSRFAIRDQWGSPAVFTLHRKVRASQLRGSGGVSPRFPNIPKR
jgi:hypothetical protein